MKGRFGYIGRSAAALGIALTMLVAAGTGAGAAARISLTNYTASGVARTVHLQLNIPALSSTPLGNIDESISFTTALGQWDKATSKIVGSSQARILDGAPLSLKTTSAAVRKASSAPVTSTDKVLAQDVAGLLHVGVGETSTTASSAVNAASSKSTSSLASIKVQLNMINDATKGVIQSLEDTINGTDSNGSHTDGLVDQINHTLVNAGVTDDAHQLSYVDLVGAVDGASEVDLLNIGAMVSSSETGSTATSRWAKADNELLGISALGKFITIDLLKATAGAELNNLGQYVKDGKYGTYATKQIVGLSVGGKFLNLNDGTLQVGKTTVELPKSVLDTVDSLVGNVAGLHIDLGSATTSHSAGRAFAQASTLNISLAPANLFSLKLSLPTAQAEVVNGNQKVLGRRLTRTGLADTSFLILGPVLLGAAVLVRRFALSR
ncbi:MAG: hypothetical protein ABR548_12700 [Actinomycetota bacterium]|nr:hypothetical protein [Actinomycetota bacterium]